MNPTVECAVYSHIRSSIWHLSGEEQKNMLVVPPAKNRIGQPETDKKYELLKCVHLENLTEKDGKVQQRFRCLACVKLADVKGSIGIGQKIGKSRRLAESKAREFAERNFRFVGEKLTTCVEGKCQEVKVVIRAAKKDEGCKGSPLAHTIFELMGWTE